MPEFSSYAAGTPCWVDVGRPKVDRSIAFYTGHFDWGAQREPRPEAGGYTTFTLRGKYAAAAGLLEEGVRPALDDLSRERRRRCDHGEGPQRGRHGARRAVRRLSGGPRAVVQDPTGAVFGVWQPKQHSGAQLANEPGSLTWNELRTHDAEAADRFYRAAFGVEFDVLAMGGNEYRVLKASGRSVGGLTRLSPAEESLPAHWVTVFAVDDCDRALARVEELGGRRLTETMEVPTIGRFALVQDPLGATFQVIKNAPPPRAQQ